MNSLSRIRPKLKSARERMIVPVKPGGEGLERGRDAELGNWPFLPRDHDALTESQSPIVSSHNEFLTSIPS